MTPSGQDVARQNLTRGRAAKPPKVVRGPSQAKIPSGPSGGKSAESVVRANAERGNAAPAAVTHGQTASKPGRSRATDRGHAKAVVTPVHGGSSGAKHPWGS